MKWLSLLCVLMLTACGSVSQVWQGLTPRTTNPNGPQLVIALPQGELVVLVDMQQPEVLGPLIYQIDNGYYEGLYIDRVVPNLLVMMGDGQWQRRQPWAMAAPAESQARVLPAGTLGLVQNEDGTYGPHVVLMLGGTNVEQGLVPKALAVGKLLPGQRALLSSLRKGDQIVRMYGRYFPY